MDTINTISVRSRSSSAGRMTVRSLVDRLVGAVLRLEDMLEKRRSRLALYELSDEQLKDIGISRADAYREARRPFWD